MYESKIKHMQVCTMSIHNDNLTWLDQISVCIAPADHGAYSLQTRLYCIIRLVYTYFYKYM